MRYGRKLTSKNFILFIEKNKNGFHRLGIVVKKEIGSAPFRNKMKRYLREFFRLNKNLIKGSFDIIILAKKGNMVNRYREVEEELRRVLI
jgi:ribonuclease P protein component